MQALWIKIVGFTPMTSTFRLPDFGYITSLYMMSDEIFQTFPFIFAYWVCKYEGEGL